MPDVAEKKHPCLFKKGQSGNPNGRPKGVRNKATMAAQELLDGEAETLTRKAIEKAMEGDMTALKLCLERIVPPRKERAISIDLPVGEKDSFITKLLEAATSGELTVTEAQGLLKLMEGIEIEQRLTAIERELPNLKKK